MSARLQPSPGPATLRPMQVADLDTVMVVETGAYPFPWTRGNFIDSLAAGYHALVLEDPRQGVVGYFVAMAGVGEMHLLNVTVAADRQRQGLGGVLLDALEDLCRRLALEMLWLEVRESNAGARALYRRRGFAEVGRRRGYYPAPHSKREDAIVMSLRVLPEAAGAVD